MNLMDMEVHAVHKRITNLLLAHLCEVWKARVTSGTSEWLMGTSVNEDAQIQIFPD
jgi:hypothetical protein